MAPLTSGSWIWGRSMAEIKSRKPRWAKCGFKTQEEYRAACAATKRTERAAMASTTATNGISRVLQVMWREADFHQPYVTITKEQIMAKAPCSLSTVKRAWRYLRAEGSIKPVRGWEGGAKVATKFKLCIAGRTDTPSDDHITVLEHERQRAAAWTFLRDKFGAQRAMELFDGTPPLTPSPKKGVQNEPKRGFKLDPPSTGSTGTTWPDLRSDRKRRCAGRAAGGTVTTKISGGLAAIW